MKAKKTLWLILVLSVLVLLFPSAMIFGDTKTAIDSSSGKLPNTVDSFAQVPSESTESVELPDTVDSFAKAPSGNTKKTKEEKLKEEKGKALSEAIDSSLEPFSAPVFEALAEEKSGKDFASRELTYANFKDDLKYFTSKVYFKNDFFGLSSETNYLFNTIIQGIFWVTKFIFGICASIYSAVSDFGSIDGAITTVIDASAEIYNNLMSTAMLGFIGGLFVVYAFFLYATGRGSFFKTLFKLLVVYAATFIFFSKAPTGDYYLTRAYNNVNSVFANIAADVSGSTDVYGSGEDAVLDSYFEKVIWQPYAYMNADRTDKPAEGSSLGLNLSDDDLKTLLGYEQDDGGFKVGDDRIDKLADEKDPKVINLTNNWGEKASYAFGSIVNALVLGVVIDFFGLVAFVLNVMLLIIFAFSWLYLIISLFPTLSGVLINFGKRTIILTGLSGFMTFFTVIFMYIYELISNFIMEKTSDYILTVFLNLVILYLTYRFRGQIIGIITGDRLNLTGAGSRMRSRWSAYRRRRGGAGSSGGRGLSKLALARASMLGARNSAIRKGMQSLNRKREEFARNYKAKRLAKQRGVSEKQARPFVNAESDYKKAKREETKRLLANDLNRKRASAYRTLSEGAPDSWAREELANRSQKYQDRIVKPNKALERAEIKREAHKKHLEKVAKRNAGVERRRQETNNRFVKEQVSALSKKKGISPKKAYKDYSSSIRKQRLLKGEPDRLSTHKLKVKQVKTREV
ncbi:hypothetical protein AB3329_01895 [Streptococcus sp. H31]|uniref:hypothetical protein n=1 Tax=Streptococcus huangxiaojuni TaxID=3237239 RepID=UPI0034A3ED8C